jgi:hypothetical protein
MKLREEHRVRVFENRVLRRIFGHEKKGTLVGWRSLHNEIHSSFISASYCEHCNEPCGSPNGGEFPRVLVAFDLTAICEPIV